MGLVLFLLFILFLLGITFFVSVYFIMKEGEDKRAFEQLQEVATKYKDPKVIKKIYSKDSFKKNRIEITFDDNNVNIKDNKNRRNLLFSVEDILDIKKEYSGKKIDIPYCDFVWSAYGITIKYRENNCENHITYWFNDTNNENNFGLVDNVETSIMIDAIIYKILKLKNVA